VNKNVKTRQAPVFTLNRCSITCGGAAIASLCDRSATKIVSERKLTKRPSHLDNVSFNFTDLLTQVITHTSRKCLEEERAER